MVFLFIVCVVMDCLLFFVVILWIWVLFSLGVIYERVGIDFEKYLLVFDDWCFVYDFFCGGWWNFVGSFCYVIW